jgi:CDP-diacylglycerol---glycerol-3-phosphate 3-phosphatidyltransferase
MLNFLRPFFARLFSPLIQALARTPVTPNMITVAGAIGVSVPCLVMFPIGWLFPGAATATVFTFMDMLDGQLARIKGDSGRFGAFLDSTTDRFADACVFGAITIWFIKVDHLLAIVSMFCLACGLCVSYVKARAEGLGLNANVGLVERPERLTIGLTAIGLSGLGIPYVLPVGMWGLAAGTAITLCQRMRCVYLDAKAKDGQAQAQPPAPEQSAPHPPAPAALAPEPLAPEPLAPEPLAPEPLAPEPLTPEQLTPEQPGAIQPPPAAPGPAQPTGA